MNLSDLRFDSRRRNIAASLLMLCAAGVVDRYVENYTLILIYVMIVVWVANNIGGKYSYAYIAMTAIVRIFDNVESTDPIVWMWTFLNLYMANAIVVAIILQNNKIMSELETTSLTDPLTRLFNRRGFERRLTAAIAHVRRYDEKLSIAYIDVDGFKAVNDTKGHAKGDELLYGIGTTIASCLRTEDVAGRLGGDEFGIIFTHTAVPTGNLIQRIKNELDSRFKESFNVSFSIGVIHYFGQSPVTVKEIVNRADELMYRVKKTSKDAVLEELF